MRARNIKPGFFKNADLAECSAFARLLAPGLWQLADRDGRLEDRPKQIKGEIFPYDNIEIEPLLDELVRAKHIIRYYHGEQRFIQVCKFREHQRPHTNETPSHIPAQTDATEVKKLDNSIKVESAANQGSNHFALNADCLTTDSLIPDSKKESKKVRQQRGSRFTLTDLPDEWRDFCLEKRPDLDPAEVFAEFRDYWIAVPGQRGCKLDWFSTWRNRVRDKKRFLNGSDPPKTFDEIRKEKNNQAIEEARKRYV